METRGERCLKKNEPRQKSVMFKETGEPESTEEEVTAALLCVTRYSFKMRRGSERCTGSSVEAGDQTPPKKFTSKKIKKVSLCTRV